VNNGKLEAIGSPNEVLTDELLLRVFKVQASRNLSNLNLELPTKL
jgi:ABC-type hemin transport system ATPase subunit